MAKKTYRRKPFSRPSRNSKTAVAPQQESARAVAMDYFRNTMARMGWGTASLAEGTDYEMVRLSNNYWLMLTLYRNSWLARRIVDLPAQDMTRTWPRIVSDIEPDDIKDFDRTVKRTYTQRQIRKALKWARLYGGSGALMVIKGHEDILDKPLDLDDVNPGSYMGLIPFDRWVGIWPYDSNIGTDFSKPNEFGLPESYRVQSEDSGQGFAVHASRILRFSGPDVPTPELQAQMHWGISQLELVYEELRKKDNASWSILQLLFRANLIARIDPNLEQLLSGVGANAAALQRFQAAMQAQNELLSNQSMLIMGKDAEMQAVQYSFAGIGEAYAQFQMDTAGAAEIPVTRLFGRTITGLGQSNDADERYYEESIAQKQNEELGPAIDQLYPVICMSQFGEVPDDLDYTFPSIRVLTEEDKGEVVTKVATPILAAFDSGVIGRKTALKELRQLGDTTNIFTNITDADIDNAEEEPELPGEAMPGAEGGEVPKTPESIIRKSEANAADAALLSKSEVDFEHPAKGRDLCGSCKYFEVNGPHTCQLVAGDDIQSQDWCKEYVRRPDSLADHELQKRIKWQGLDVSIENRAGSVRSGRDKGGNVWSVKMTHDYGYLNRTQGVDGDHLDCFIGPDARATHVYVIHTLRSPDFIYYDEDKCMLNFASPAAARKAFFANYDRPEHFGSMDTFTVAEFKKKALATEHRPGMLS